MKLSTPKDLDKAHELAASLTIDSSPDEVLAVVREYKKAAWPDWADDHPNNGTIAWFIASFLEPWLETHTRPYHMAFNEGPVFGRTTAKVCNCSIGRDHRL